MKKKTALLLCILTSTLYSAETIIKEYPELADFITSPDFESLLLDYTLDVTTAGSKDDSVAQVQIELNSSTAITKKLVLNSYYINKKVLSAEELKFILCHELGHLQDPHLKKIVGSTVGLFLGALVATISVSQALFTKQYESFFKRSLAGVGLYTIARLVLMQWMRQGETYADTYAFHITKNKEAGISALEKRGGRDKNKRYRNKLLQTLYRLFDDHPTEDERIAHIESLECR